MLQPKRREQLDANIKELLANGGSNADIEKLAQDFTAKFGNEVEKKNQIDTTSTSITPPTSSESVPKNGFLDMQKSVDEKSAPSIFSDFEKQIANKKIVSKQIVSPKKSYSKTIFKKAKSEVDENLTEQNLQKEKEQSGFLNRIGQGAKAILNVTGQGLSAINETLGGDKDYFVIDDYKPLQDEKKQAKKELETQGLPTTEDAIQKQAENIFRRNDKFQQLQKRIDANLPENYDREGIWKDLKLENLKKNDVLKQSVISAQAYNNQINDFNKYRDVLKNTPKENVSQEQIQKYNDLLEDANESVEGLKYLETQFPKILKEVKTSDELLDVFKYNYNDYEKAFSNIKNFTKTLAGGTVKLAAETLSYIDEKTDKPGSVPTEADKIFKKGLQATKEIANEVLDESSAEREQFATYKAKDINNFSDFGSFMADLSTNQLPVYATLLIAPEMGTVLLGGSQGGEQFRSMEKEEEQPFTQRTTFGQKLATSYMYGAAETLFERLGTVSILKNMEKSIARASNTSRKLIQDGALQETARLGKQFGYNFGLEGGTEYLTAEAQIGADRYIANKDISTQKANERRSESFIAGGLMGGGMTMAGGVWGGIAQKAKIYSDNKDIKKTRDILSQIETLSDELKNNQNLTKEEEIIIYKKMDDLSNQSFEIVTKNAEKGKTFTPKENQFLVDITVKQEEIKSKFNELKDSNFSKAQKEIFASELKNQYKELEEDRKATLDGKFSEIADNRKTINFEKTKEDNLKDDLAKETKNAETKVPTTETEQEAEVQEPTNKQEVEQEDFRLSFNDSQEVTDEKIRKSNAKAKVEQLRTQEQAENSEIERKRKEELDWKDNYEYPEGNTTIPKENWKDVIEEDKKAINAKYDAELAKTYNKYDKLITPLLEKEATPTEDVVTSSAEKQSEDVKNYNGIFSNSESSISNKGKGTKEILTPNKNRKVVMMSPDDYLKLIREGLNRNIIDILKQRKGNEALIAKYEQNIKDGINENLNEASKKNIDEAVKKGDKIDMPFVFFNEEGKMIDQDGRNRAAYAKEIGEKLIPVLIENNTVNQNEATPTTNTPTDGNVQPRVEQVAEVEIEQKPTAEVVEAEVVEPAVEPKPSERADEVSDINDIANFLNEEFINPKKEEKKAEKPTPAKETKIEQAKGFVSLAVSDLTTSLKDFQGRAKEYSEQTYNRIVNEAKEGVLNISSIPPIQVWKNPETGKFVILAGHSRTKAFSDLAQGKVEFADKYKKSDFEKVSTQIVEAGTLEEAQKIAQESNQGAVQTVVDNAKYVRDSLLPTFKNANQAKTKLKSLYGPAWARIYAYANLNPKGKAMQMLKQFQDTNESDSNDKSKKIAEWTGKARTDYSKLTDAHENEIFDYLSKNDKIKTYSELSELLNRRVNGLEEFNTEEPLNFEQKVGRGSNEVEIVKEIQDLKNRDTTIKKQIKDLQAFGKNINDSQRKQIKDLTAESIKINTVDIPNAQVKQKQARSADADQFDIFSQINEQIENGNITSEQVDEFVNDDRKAEEIEPIVEAIESKAKSDKKVELKQVVVDVENQIERKPADRGNDGGVQQYKGKSLAQQENKRPGIVVQAESKMPPTKNFVSKNYEIDEVQKQGVNSALSLFENGGKSFLLADGTGVGKTRQILVTAKEYLDKFGGKVLIISENTTILTKNFANDAKALGIDMNQFEFGTYNDLRTGKKGKDNYGLVIYDEAHNLKNQESGKAIAAGNIKSKNNMYVTATPMDTIGSAVYFISEVSGVTEEQAYGMLGLNVKKQKDAVTGQEVKIVTLQEGVAPADIKRNIVKIREEIISKGAMLRREYPFYGEFVEDKIPLTEEQSNEQDEIESNWDDRIEYESMTDDGRVNFRKKMNLSGQKSGELSRWSESTKIKYTFKEVVKAIKDGKKVVVIAEGVNETTITAIDKVVPGFLSELSKMLKAEGYKVAEIFGKSDKGEANDKFQSNEVDVVLGTAKSASTGIDLDDQNGNAPRVLFMVTPNYSGNVFQQILGRVSRRNTKSPAQVRLLFNESNIDARRKQIVNGKLQTLKAIQEGVIDDEIEIDIQESPVPSAEITVNLEGITLESISEKAFAVKGDTKTIKDNIKAIGGRYNPKYGWIFPNSKKVEVQEMLNNLAGKNEPTNEAKKISDQVRKLKIDLSKLSDGGLQSNPLGLPVAVWNASMDIIAASIDAGMTIGEAIKRGLNYIQKNNRGPWDKKAFNDEVLKELGVRGIEVNGQDVIVKPQTKEDAKVVDGFYSDIEKSLIDTKKDNLTATEWENIIGKTDEAKFTGLTDWLNGNQGVYEFIDGKYKFVDKKISKAEIREYLNDNRIEIVEVHKGQTSEFSEAELKDKINSKGYYLEYDMGGDGYIIEDKDGEFVEYDDLPNDVKGWFDSLSEITNPEETLGQKYAQYQLEGEKENYKEILVTLPIENKSKYDKASKEREEIFAEWNKQGWTIVDARQKDPKSVERLNKANKILNESSSSAFGEGKFKSSHFDESNILVHLRMNTRTDADGNKVLLLEEVQSDWGQQGKKEGFKNEEIANEREKLRIELQNKKDKVRKIENELANLKPLTSEQKEELNQERLKLEKSRSRVRNNREWDSIGKEIDNIKEKIDSYENNKNILKNDIFELNYIGDNSISNLSDNLYEFDKKNSTEGTSTAPFVMDTNSWAKLGIKTALKEAVKQGVDKIAWTTGEQQNERYDLSKSVDLITVGQQKNGDKFVSIDMKGQAGESILYYDNNGNIVENDGKSIANTVGKNLSDVIGKEIAEKILKANKGDEFKGEDLRIGGKGMKGFYGSPKEGSLGIIGEVAKALTKQEIKTITLGEVKTLGQRAEIEENRKGLFNIYDREASPIPLFKDIATREEAEKLLNKPIKNASVQYSIDITPELKSEVEKGLPMFGNLKEQQKAMVNAEVDKIAQKIKDFLPSAKGAEGLKAQGFTQDQIIDLVANAVKALISKGIDVNEAIKQVIASIKERFDIDVDENLVKEKLNITNIPQDFEREQGRKSVLNRMASGNSSIIKKAIAKYSLDYEIENQKEAKAKAEMFVNEVGVDNALIAVRKGLIDGATGAFVYARTIEILEQEINSLKGEDRLDAIADYQKLLGEISDELDNRSRSNGRFIAALAEIYNSSGGRYNLTKMVNDYKAQNNGQISKEVLEKLKNVEEKLKESEEKLAELEAKKRIEEENEAFNNILESVARKKAINTKAKITDKQKLKAFADKLRSFKISNLGGTNVSTPFSIAYDLAIEAAAQALELTGLVSDAIKAGVQSIRNANLSKDEQEQALSDLFDLFDDSDVNVDTPVSQKGMMSINEEGVLRIPNSLIREKVENGIDNIEDLVSELMTDVQELFPDLDFTERQVRDIVTGYGKISNPTQDEIETQISIMKSLGKIASGIEDANKGQRPLRSGQQRREPTMKERTEMKKLKALLRDLPLADADITKAYKTALDAIKKRLSNEIEELDDQIAKGEKRKGEKSVIEYDQEAKDLKAIRDSKKEELDNLVGKPELTDQQKIDRAEKMLQKRLDDLQQKINSNEIDYAKKPEPVTSAKLEEMRKLKKEYEAQIQKMREDAGMAEERLIEIAKRNATKRLATLKERIANGDFEKRKRKPTPTDVELNKIKSEIAQQKEIFDKEVYKLELKNRKIEQKALDLLKDILSVPKILSFTADLSFVGIQNVTQIYKMAANSLVNLAKTGKLKGTFRDAMTKTFKAMASPDFEQKFMQAVKANPDYQLWKESKLGIVESHYKEAAKAEVFQNNALSTLFSLLGNYVASKGYEKGGNVIKDYINIISIFERGQTVFENQMRINRFKEGADLLKSQGFNPIDDIQEYKKVAAAVNTLTGRANTGSKAASALRELNGTIFSSFSNWAAGVNQLNPYWYYTLTPTARKMALTDVAHHIIGAGSMLSLAALYTLGQDDEDEDKVVVETDPTSSDFAVIKIGNLRIDPWAGKKTTVVAFSRLVNGEKKDKYGNLKKYGIEYDDEDWIDLPLEYVGNKIAPGPRFALDRFFRTKEVEYKGTSFREDKYGTDFKKSKYLVPLIFENFREVNEEQPGLFGKATMALSWTGLINTNVYGGMQEGFKDMPDDLIEKEYKVKIQKVKDNEKILEFNLDKLTKDYVDKKISKFQIMQKVDSLVVGDAELFNKSMKSVIKKVNKEELKTLVTDPFYLGLKKEKNPEIQAILFYAKFKDDKGMSAEDKKERDKNLRYVEFDFRNPKFIRAYQELKNKTPNN